MNVFIARLITLSAALFEGSGNLRQSATTVFEPLKFDENGSFRISVFSDFHLGMYPRSHRGQKQDIKSVQVMSAILDQEKPDLVVLNGDLINGDSVSVITGIYNIDKILKPLVARKLTWASTHGNHDHQPNLSSRLLFAREKKFAGSRTMSMVPNEEAGTTNYYLPVYGADCRTQYAAECTPEMILWFFDSRGGYFYQSSGFFSGPVKQPNWVHDSVAFWFQHTQARLDRLYGRVIPSLAFVHIPVFASRQLQRLGVDPHRQPGINGEKVSPQGAGWCLSGRSGCEYGMQDAPFMAALAATPGLIGVFSGHDHFNSWCHKWLGRLPGVPAMGRGASLCYGQHTGYGGYGNMIRGSREIRVSVDRLKYLEVDSYIRTEKNHIVGAVSLNATYGKDKYPATPKQKSFL